MTYSIVLLSFPLNKLLQIFTSFLTNLSFLDFDCSTWPCCHFCSESTPPTKFPASYPSPLLFSEVSAEEMLPVGILSLCSEVCFYCCLGDLSPHIPPSPVWLNVNTHPSRYVSLCLFIFLNVSNMPTEWNLKGTRDQAVKMSPSQRVRSFPTGSSCISTSKKLPVGYWWLCSLISSPDLSPGLQRPCVSYPLDTNASGKPAPFFYSPYLDHSFSIIFII